jgi:hypothetical protein
MNLLFGSQVTTIDEMSGSSSFSTGITLMRFTYLFSWQQLQKIQLPTIMLTQKETTFTDVFDKIG